MSSTTLLVDAEARFAPWSRAAIASAPPCCGTDLAGALTRADVGREVRLGGWVHRRRDLGGLVFIDLRDRDGLVQLSCNPEWTPPEIMERAAALGAETVILAGRHGRSSGPSRRATRAWSPARSRCTSPGSRWSARRRRRRFRWRGRRRRICPRRSFGSGIGCSTSGGPSSSAT